VASHHPHPAHRAAFYILDRGIINKNISCGVPLFSNKPTAVCKNCGTVRELALNPRIIGSLADEAGSIALGKLIWSDRAWNELFFGSTATTAAAANGITAEEEDVRTPEKNHGHPESLWKELTGLDSVALREVDERLQYSRVTLTFGWSSEVGRLCVLGVEW
jgi:hypothetical protein